MVVFPAELAPTITLNRPGRRTSISCSTLARKPRTTILLRCNGVSEGTDHLQSGRGTHTEQT